MGCDNKSKYLTASPDVVDSIPPVVTLIQPLDGETLYLSDLRIIIKANATDNIAPEQIELYIDGDLISARYDFPSTWSIITQREMDTTTWNICAHAYDAAGNGDTVCIRVLIR